MLQITETALASSEVEAGLASGIQPRDGAVSTSDAVSVAAHRVTLYGIKRELVMYEDTMNRKASSYGFVIGFLALFFAASILTGCSTASRDSVAERNKRLVLNMNHELWNKGNLDRIEDFFSPGFVRHFLPDGSELRGIDSLREQETRHREAFPDWREDIKHIVAEGDLVVIHFVSTGTNKGSWLGNPPTGRRIQIHEMSILRIEDGKIAEQWLLPDMLSMQQQLTRPEHE